MSRARIVNVLVWLYVWLSQILLPVMNRSDFAQAKIEQLFRFGPFDDLPRLLGRAFVPAIFCALVDWRLRRIQARRKSAPVAS